MVRQKIKLKANREGQYWKESVVGSYKWFSKYIKDKYNIIPDQLLGGITEHGLLCRRGDRAWGMRLKLFTDIFKFENTLYFGKELAKFIS